MKINKAFKIMLSAILSLSFTASPINANEPIESYSQNSYSFKDNQTSFKSRITRTVTNEHIFYIHYTEYEIYYFDENNNKIILALVEDCTEEFKEETILRAANAAPSISKFQTDFYQTSSNQKSMKVTNDAIIQGADFVANMLADYLISLIAPTFWTGAALSVTFRVIARSVVAYPPESIVYYNITNYRNKMCTQYLNGRTYQLKHKGELSNLLYEYSWSENPQLGIVISSCKVASQTWTYPKGRGQ